MEGMENLPAHERLRGRGHISRLFNTGGRGSTSRLAARALANDLGYSRLVAVAGKGLGNAVVRGRLRRRIRAAFRIEKIRLPVGYDVAVIARPGLLEAAWEDVREDLRQALTKAVRSAAGPRPTPPRL